MLPVVIVNKIVFPKTFSSKLMLVYRKILVD